MTLQEAIVARQYIDKPIEADIVNRLNEEISVCNQESELNIQLVINEPKAFAAGYTKMDLGIVKYHFEIAAGKDNFHWQ